MVGQFFDPEPNIGTVWRRQRSPPYVIPAPRVPDRARAGPGRDPCTAPQTLAQRLWRDRSAGPSKTSPVRSSNRSTSHCPAHSYLTGSGKVYWVPAWSRSLASLASGAGMTAW